jgi:hypothetical protein
MRHVSLLRIMSVPFKKKALLFRCRTNASSTTIFKIHHVTQSFALLESPYDVRKQIIYESLNIILDLDLVTRGSVLVIWSSQE